MRVFFFLLGLFAFSALAADPPANRWLLIVETSRDTQSRADAVAQLGGNLILSGMNGQMHAGDTLGVWTFNKSLHTGEFPLQTWTPETAKTIAERAAMFLATRKFQSRPDFGKVSPAMEKIATNSAFLTVVVISSGGEKFRGTPYDSAINTIFKKWQTQQEKAGQPFVTVLRAEAGRFNDFKVNLPPAPLEMPELPPELAVAKLPAKPAAQAPAATNAAVEAPPPPPPSAMLPPLIVHGKKPEAEPEIQNNAPATNSIAAAPRTSEVAAAEIKTNPPVAAAPVVLWTNAPATNVAAVIQTNAPTAKIETPASSPAKFFLIGALAIAGIGLGVYFGFSARKRTAPRASLITRSLERDKK